MDPEQLTCCHFLKLWPKEECDECSLDQRIRTTSHGQGLQAAPHSVTPWEVRMPCSPRFCLQGLFFVFLLIIFNHSD